MTVLAPGSFAASPARLRQEVAAQGFARLPGAEVAALLGPVAASPALLAPFAASWDRLELDGFMADGGRYRRRRHANFRAFAGQPGHLRGPHRPHFQAKVHNPLHGDMDRWFAPVEEAVADSPTLRALLELGRGAADALQAAPCDWFVEMHQFRIEAEPGAPGHPTPEGVHHDGVDLVLIAMIRRTNLAGGETLVQDPAGRPLARFTLEGLLDTAVLDDTRVMHGVTPVEPADPALPSRRDVLVLTWKRAATAG